MEDIDKLRHLMEHWIEHNAEHEKTYADWASKALKAGNPELSEILKDIAAATRNMENLFLKAMKAI